MTQDQIAELREMLAKATPGDWFEAEGGVCAVVCPEDGSNIICLEPERMMLASLAKWRENAAFIVAAKNALPSLLDELAALLDRIEKLTNENGRTPKHPPVSETASQPEPSSFSIRSESTLADGEASANLLTKENPDARG